MQTVIATISVNVDIEDDETAEQIQNDARAVLIDLIQSGAEIVIDPA